MNKEKGNKIGIMIGIIIFLMIVLIFSFIIYNASQKFPTKCTEYGQVKYRLIGSGGLFGGVEKVEVHGDNYDGYMEVCLKGKTIFNKDWERPK